MATRPATSGAQMAGMTTVETTPFQMTPLVPTAASMAPTMPPMSACDELEGMPSSQVSRFQTMPPTSPANTSSRVTRPASTNPLAMVAATAVDRKAPTRFSEADRVTATLGLRAPLAMDVAMAFPVSWKPLVKSNASAVITTMIRVNSCRSTLELWALLRPAVKPIRKEFAGGL